VVDRIAEIRARVENFLAEDENHRWEECWWGTGEEELATNAATDLQFLLSRLAELTNVATGEMAHVWNGKCPDRIEGFTSRDPKCPACAALSVSPEPKEGNRG